MQSYPVNASSGIPTGLSANDLSRQLSGGESAKVLVVEDNLDALMLVSFLLKRRGYEVLTANSVRAAIELGTKTDFDILLCDIGLPDGEGSQVLHALQEGKQFPSIALTAHATSEDIEEQIDAGFDLHISKPYQVSYLEEGIRKLLGREN